MATQKYQTGQTVMLREIGGQNLPYQSVEIVGFAHDNAAPYRIRYQKEGDEFFTFEDVPEERLISVMDIAGSTRPQGE
jgi:hypothetical protein